MSQSDTAAKAAIAEVLSRYCRAWDRADEALAFTVWHEDGTAQYLDEPVSPARTMIPQRFRARRAAGIRTSHQITNMVVEVKGERAVSEAYGTAWSHEPLTGGDIHETHYFARYLDRWSRRDGVWAIDHRRVLLDGHSTRRFTPDPRLDAAGRHGRMGPDDPSYAHFDSLDDD